jgi:dipeptidyl aminopeptidase/acylaminoacyl peptidase
MSAVSQVRPCGSWPTPITSALVVEGAVHILEARADGDVVMWAESRPDEGGRTALVRRSADGTVADLLAREHNARTAAHEYGGGAWWAGAGAVWFTEWSDQRVYRLDPASGRSMPLTTEPSHPRGDRYADGELTPDGAWIVCVRERHPPGGGTASAVRNEIVRLAAHAPSEPEVLVSGPDFVSNPRPSPDGERLCWLEWDHPNMPWDQTRLRIRDWRTGEETTAAGGPGESVAEPQWQPDGSLTFISDRTGWWNLYRLAPGAREVEPLVQVQAEIGVPQWTFGVSRYAVLGDGRIVFARWRDGFDGLAVRTRTGRVVELDLPYTLVRSVRSWRGRAGLVVAATARREAEVALVEPSEGGLRCHRTVRAPRRLEDAGVGPGCIAVPDAVQFPSERGRTAHALLYRPVNDRCRAPEGELPPMLVEVHGGPTSAARPELSLEVQFWTSRGFAFLDLNYGGSTGYGRAYRELLRGNWGVVDVEDAIAAARWAEEQREADPRRICIRGASAGGFTTLAALARAQTPFAAGADWFGVADLEALARDTHKFEARYLDSLVGPYPEARERYRERSPIAHVEEFSRPLIVLQGLEDEVVPPNQAAMIVRALRAKGVPVAYVTFAGEQHGLRRAESIRRALEAELSFYAQVLGFPLPDGEAIAPVAIQSHM